MLRRLHGGLGARGRAPRSCRCGNCWACRRARVADQGHLDPGDRRPHPPALRSVHADPPRVRGPGGRGAVPLPCRPRASPSTSAPAPACWLRCSPRRGIQRVIATDQDPRALACARENIERLDLATQVEVVEADLFPEGRPRSSSATRPGSRRARALPSSAGSTTRRARCCAASSRAAGAPAAGRRGLAGPVRPCRAPGPAGRARS